MPNVSGEGALAGAYIRRSLKTKSWERAQAECHRLEEADNPAPKKTQGSGITIQEAVESYLQDGKDRGLREATLYKLNIIFRKQFLTWAANRRFTPAPGSRHGCAP